MADSRSKPGRPSPAVGEARSPWQPIFMVAVLAFAFSIVILVVVAADSLGSDGNGTEAVAPDPSETAGATATQPGSTATAPAAETPTEVATPGADGKIVVACGDLLAPLDKEHRLPDGCEPGDLEELPGAISWGAPQYLRSTAATALYALFDAASSEGFTLTVNSSYRSYQSQVETFNSWVNIYGEEYAERTSARPGHSEHQLGTAADVGARGLVLEAFTGTPEAAWLAQNAPEFGFIVSYPDGAEAVTGYAYEPWHIRYVGTEVAAQVVASGLTLHEFLLQ